MVIMMICRSTHNDALRTYHSPNFSFSSLVTTLALMEREVGHGETES